MEDLSLPDILAILKRRSKSFCAITAILFTISLIFALHWSNYRSTATVEIDQPYVSQNVAVTSGGNMSDTIFSLADQRISQIEQKVTALGSLAEIISKFDLYPEARKTVPIAEQADVMRDKIKLNFISSAVSNPAAAQKESAEQLSAIAFTISFDYSNPQIAQQVTNELVTRFLDEDLKQRRIQTHDTSEFLAAQIKDLETTMADQEKKIADFRAQHGESGPSMMMFEQQGAANTAFSIQNLDTQITSNEGAQGSLRAQLAVVDPYSRVIADGQVITTPAIQLKALEAQYATLSSQYGPDYPDVLKARQEIQALKAQIGAHHEDQAAQLKAQIIDAKTNLAAAQSTYGPDNPDVITLKQNLKNLEDRLAAMPKDSTTDAEIKQDADNPAYLELAVQLKSAEEQHKALLAERDALNKQREKYQHDIAENPALEQQMATLSRDYENSQLRYRELKEKKMAADMGEKLEEDRKGQRLLVVNPPKVPRTTQPARLLLLFGGVIFSIIGGLGSITVAEALNQSIHGQNHLEAVIGAAPLVAIPHLRTIEEINYALQRRRYLIGAIVFLIILALIVFAFV